MNQFHCLLKDQLQPLPSCDFDDLNSVNIAPHWDDQVADFLKTVAATSPYLRALMEMSSERLSRILMSALADYLDQAVNTLNHNIAQADGEAEAMAALRQFKQDTALSIALWDLGRAAPQATILQALSDMAVRAVQAALIFLIRQAAASGRCDMDGFDNDCEGLGLTILGMGKLGAGELNYSSDIDLICLYDPEHHKLSDNQEPSVFWARLARRLVRLLQERTGEGYVYRVDLRLRPDPASTPLAVSLPAALQYYESLGQNWERAALIKARPIAGDRKLGCLFLQEITPFIWRKYLDYAALESIHTLKQQIHIHKGYGDIRLVGHNIKVGRGGIREIEFFVQTQQLIAGGRNPVLRGRKTLDMLRALHHAQWVDQSAMDDLSGAYEQLRMVENRIQMREDAQSHIVPEATPARLALAKMCGFDQLEAFEAGLLKTLQTVQRHYDRLFSGPDSQDNYTYTDYSIDHRLESKALQQLGFQAPDKAIDIFSNWHRGLVPATRSDHSRTLLLQLTPSLLAAFADSGHPDQALTHFDCFINRLPAGVQLFALLKSHPELLHLLSRILGSAPRLAGLIIKRPHVLDALLDPSFFNATFSKTNFRQHLRASLSQARSYEDALDRARIFGQEQIFLIGVRLLSQTVAPQEAAQAYSNLAEACIIELLAHTQAHFIEQHGTILGAKLCILAMGKLGSQEMTATSDLDLILLYEFAEDSSFSNGPKPLSAQHYFMRLTQRLTTALSAPTAEGTLYALDFRLRPSGNKGPLATQFSSFRHYQKHEAWVWEHMALTRARAIAGDADFCARAHDYIRDVLTYSYKTKPKRETLRQEAAQMLEKIRQNKPPIHEWDVKTILGGLVDIEFCAQVLQLSHAQHNPDILNPSTCQALENLNAHGRLSDHAYQALVHGFRFYQSLQQYVQTALGGAPDWGNVSAEQALTLVGAQELQPTNLDQLKAEMQQHQTRITEIVSKILNNQAA